VSRDSQLLEPPVPAGEEAQGAAATGVDASYDPAARSPLAPTDTFPRRHLGSGPAALGEMLATVGAASLDELVDEAVPRAIRMDRPLALPGVSGLPAERPPTERELLARMREMASKNHVYRSLIGLGYHDCVVPGVIQRNVLENPGWYTQYTPYQSEISQGRLEALLNFQTMVADLTGLPVANASLLDEGTAAAEAMSMCLGLARRDKADGAFFVADHCHPQTLAVVETRADDLADCKVEAGCAETLSQVLPLVMQESGATDA